MRDNAVPDVQIPTDEHLKQYKKKISMPEKSAIIAATKASKRLRARHTEEWIV